MVDLCTQLSSRTTLLPCRKLRQPSKIVDVVLPRPLGIILKEDARRQRVVVESFIPGSHADKLAKVSAQHDSLHAQARPHLE